jgi:predicted kinase
MSGELGQGTRLIVLRGPSGSGKSTIARRLFELAKARTCLIEQDYYRFIFKPAGGGSQANAATIHRMIQHNVLAALADGYDVILEGILNVRSYGGVLDEIFAAHTSNNFLYYFDVSLPETLRRHTSRKTAEHTFTEEDMRDWYPAAHASHHDLERVIPESSTALETLSRILEETRGRPATPT